ncbi:MAG TPA: outer membrane beta-barrel protein, partial [Gemmatimonadales bacterium]|nr:outer membrane beta-barrel protein [Gemmatimonadales bacterium]
GTAALALGLLFSAPVAHAQGAEFSLGAGLTVPLSDFGDAAKTGFNGLVGISFAPSSFPLGIQIDGMYQRLKQEDVFPGDRSNQIIQGTANLVYKFKTSEESTFRPYIIGGVGIYNFKLVGGDDVSPPGEGDTGTDFGVNAGAGFDFKAGGAGLFVEGRFHNVFGDGTSDANFIPITAGIRLGGN